MARMIRPLANLYEQLRRLPGVGSKTAMRLAYHIIDMPESEVQQEQPDAGAEKVKDVESTSDALEAKKKAFRELINGEYKDLYTQETQRMIDRRFKEAREMEQRMKSSQPVLDTLMERYNIQDGDAKRLLEAVDNDHAYWSEAAEEAGMSEEQIAAMKEYDWAWFCSQRVFQNHTQPIPCEQYDEVCGQSQLFRKFASLSYQWDVDKIDQTRYGWLASVENEQLLLRLKKLSKKDLELLTLLFVDGYRQIDVARLWHCSRSAVAQRFKKIKKFLNNT